MNKASTALLRPCLGCGVLVIAEKRNVGARCVACQRVRKEQFPARQRQSPQASSARRGYGHAWRKLSREARRTHPFCVDCGTSDDLTGDHLRWPARTLLDVEVVCRSCNSKRGALRRAGQPVSVREPLHTYAAPKEIDLAPWGGSPLGGVLDREGGAAPPVTLSGSPDAALTGCITMHGDVQ